MSRSPVPGLGTHGAFPSPTADTLAVGEGVVLAYEDTIAVRASTFTIPLGGVTAIIGPNGSGKSTLLHSLAGLVEPRSGKLTVLGASPTVRSGRVSYVLQSVAVPTGIPITVRETVMMGRYSRLGWFKLPSRSDRQRVAETMEEMRITPLANRHLDELSGGQRQRVHVAQGIAQEHDVLLLDEPLTGLDIVSAKTIDELIHAESERGCSVVMTTHDLAEARAADWVILMAGKVIASGPPDAVLTRANLDEAYGLGALHEHPDVFLDDPAPHTDLR